MLLYGPNLEKWAGNPKFLKASVFDEGFQIFKVPVYIN